MNRELELLVLAYDALIEARGADAKRAVALYDSRLNDSLDLHPSLSRETLDRLVRLAHGNWVAAQKRPSAMPPEAFCCS